MEKNTGLEFQNKVYEIIEKMIKDNEFLLSNPFIKIKKNPKYYSKDREKEIEFDISVEKYFENPENKKDLRPGIIVIIECKDYASPIPVDDVEEFHAKLQQIGADNTKGIMITSNNIFQQSAYNYAKSKGITLARILPDNQIEHILYCMTPIEWKEKRESENMELNLKKALTQKEYHSKFGKDFFSSSKEEGLNELINTLLK